MTELYIDDHKVVVEPKDIKVTRENPYFSSSGDYTLEVEIPLNNVTNCNVFGHLHRIDVKKESKKYKAMFISDNVTVLNGTASLTQVNEKKVKLQLFGGNSEVNFKSTIDKVYIDQIDYGDLDFSNVAGDVSKVVFGGARGSSGGLKAEKYVRISVRWEPSAAAYCGNIGQFLFMPIYDETNDAIKNLSGLYIDNDKTKSVLTVGNAVQPNLFYVINKLIEYFGYSLRNNELNSEPWNRIFIANACGTLQINKALPHRTAKEFFTEVEKFFNCTLVFDSVTHTAELIRNTNFFKSGLQGYEAADIFTCELLDDDDTDKALAASNIKYDVSSSDEHMYDVLTDEILQEFEHKKYSSRSEMVSAISSLSEDERKKYIFECPEGDFIWATDVDSTDDSGSGEGGFGPGNKDSTSTSAATQWFIKQVNLFGPLIRDEKSEDFLELKICPVAMSIENRIPVYQQKDDGNTQNHGKRYDLIAECIAQMPSMENPVGDARMQSGNTSVWEVITGEEEINEANDPEDRLQVFFAGNKLQYVNKDDAASQSTMLPYPMAFTDYLDKAVDLKASNYLNTHEPWSMSLRPSGATSYIGQLHDNNFAIETKVETQISFLADTLPDVRKFFLFRNKRYICKKYEINVKPNGIDKLIKGYFYEVK